MRTLIETGYGGKRGLARHLGARAGLIFGAFRRFERLDWGRVNRLIFVCSGNICRSPYAEARARALGIEAKSFGLAASSGVLADATAREVAASRGVDLSHHRASRQEDIELFAGDLIVVMEPNQADKLLLATPLPAWQLTLLGVWSLPPRPFLNDPYGLSKNYYATCFDIIDSMVEGTSKRLLSGASRRDSKD